MENTRRNRILLLLSVLFVLTAVFGFVLGSAQMDISTLFAALLQKEGYETQSLILYSLRLPRLFAGTLAGIGLSVSGALLQSITGNELASPNILGINAGAGFCMIALLSFFPQAVHLSPVVCFVGAFATALLILAVGNRLPRPKTGILLAGVAVTAVFNAGISLVSLLDTDVLAAYRFFSVGGLDGTNGISSLFLPAIMIFGSLIASLVLASRADALSLGDLHAASLGIRPARLRAVCLALAAASAAAVVSFAGLLGFVGLIVPHLARKTAGQPLRLHLPVCALGGAVLVCLSDLIGRLVIAPAELPVGILMALAGAPFYFVVLFRRSRDAVL
ncbi:MAG: iron ABC transporter permease [Clostridia bacterium]|nr:iron ABC transporter permease [Clostridia bacterium]